MTLAILQQWKQNLSAMKGHEELMALYARVAVEQDRKKLLELVREINSLLEQNEALAEALRTSNLEKTQSVA